MRDRMTMFALVLLTGSCLLGCDRPLAFYEEEDEIGTQVLLANVLYEPHLIRPKNGSTIRSSSEVTLRWSWIPSADNYSVQVAKDTSFVNPVFAQVADTTFTRTDALGGSTFYWRVRSNKGGQTSEWSRPNLFYLKAQ